MFLAVAAWGGPAYLVRGVREAMVSGRSPAGARSRDAGPGQIGSVEERQPAPGAPTVVCVPLAELRLEQGLLGVHPLDERREQQERDQDADRATEDQGPTEEAKQQ